MQNPVKRIAAIHDLSGFGRASLTVVMPILSTMGIQVCPLPTAILSTHGKFKGFHFIDLTDDMRPILSHWEELNLKFDGIYSGFLGSPGQVDIVKECIRTFPSEKQLITVDPVLGDDGKIYGALDQFMVEKMRDLISHANLITPNLTEASLLLGKKYPANISEKEIKDWIRALSDKGPEMVIITSVPDQQSKKRSSVIAYNRGTRRFWKVSVNYLPAYYPGTGDSFASVIVGSLMQGDSLPIALDRAVNFISYGVRATFGYDYDPNEGILLEKILNTLHTPVQMSSYELMD